MLCGYARNSRYRSFVFSLELIFFCLPANDPAFGVQVNLVSIIFTLENNALWGQVLQRPAGCMAQNRSSRCRNGTVPFRDQKTAVGMGLRTALAAVLMTQRLLNLAD